MASLAGFDATQVPEQQDFAAIPAGTYMVIATASEDKPTKNGTGSYLQFTFEVLDGQFKGRKLWDRLNLRNPNAQAVEIAQRALGGLCKAVGVLKPNDSSELHNKPLAIVVAVEKGDKGQEVNVIKKYEPVAGMQQQPQFQAPQQQPAQQFQQPVGQPTQAPAAAPWGAPAAATPWAK